MERTQMASAQSGFLMLEVLITMFILVLGLLGVVGLQARAQQAETESYQRTQALILLRDMADRITANPANAASYVTGTSGNAVMGTGSGKDCSAPTAMADQDLCQWSSALVGAAESLNGNSVGTMIGARGCITSPAANVYMVQVAWQGLAPTAAPPNSVACGSGSYGVEEQRRVVTTIVQIGQLSTP
jgi:type IV pilus assembly protein PilV